MILIRKSERLGFILVRFFCTYFTINEMNNSTFDMAAKSENLYSNSILRLYKQNMMLKFMEIKSNETKLTQKEISNQLGFSDSTITHWTSFFR